MDRLSETMAEPPTPEPRRVMPAQPSSAAGSTARQEIPPPMLAARGGAALPNGTHQVQFADGSAYYGEWQGGSMHGRGVFFWPAGARYEGEWQHGREEGTGTFYAPGRGTYYGSWRGGQMHGKCVYTPDAGPAAVEAPESTAPTARLGQVVFLQRYEYGQLVAEQVLRVAHKDVRKKQQKKEGKKQAKREAKQLQAYHTPKPGEAVYKGHWSYILMRELQLGITFCIAQAGLSAADGAQPSNRDFHEETTQHFPPGAETPPFKWKDYAPRVFQRLREEFGIDNSDYLLSLTGDAALRLLGSPGKSGSVFFLSDDDRFLVKTVRKEEMRLLLELIPRYFRHVCANPGTLLVRFYGVHRISPLLGRRVRFIVMGNVLPSDLRMHRRYDLKGSTHGRTAGERARSANPSATLKDLDLDLQLVLPAKQHSAVLRQLRRDLELLERLHVIDYSLLLGMHFLRWGNATWHPPFADWPAEPAAAAAADGSSRGSVEDSAPASPLATRASEAAEAALAGLGAARSVTAALRPAVDSVQSAASAAAVGAQPGELNGSAYPAAPAEPMPRRLPSRLHRSTSIDAANSLAALIAANVQAARPEVQPEWQAGQRTQQPVPAAREQGAAADEVPAGQHPDASAAAAAILMQAANQSRAQARLSARAALQAACNGDDGTADAAGPLAVAGVPPLPPLPPIAEAAEAGCHSSGRALQHSTSSSTGSSLLTGASTLSTRGSSGSSDLSDETGMRGPAGGDLASKLQVAAEAALSLNGGPAAALRRMESAPEARPKEEPPATGAWWPGLTCGLGAGAVCLGSEEQGECWARPPPQPALPLSPRELAAGMGVQQGREAQHAQQAEQRQQAEAGPRLLPDSRAGSGSLGGSSLGSPQGSSVGAAAGHRVAAPAAACAALQQQQQQLGRLLSLRSDGGEPGSSGRAVPAVAIRRGSGGQLQCEPVLLFFGIIDFLQDYTLRKHLERWSKAAVWGGRAVSVAAPSSYSHRFLAAMQRVLISSDAAEAGLGCRECGGGSGGKELG